MRVFLATAALLVLLAPAASAHDHVEALGGKVELSIGFETEPAYTGVPNGVVLRVRDEAANATVPGLVLKVDVMIGGEKTTLDLEPVRGAPGSYVGRFIPTSPGTYTFRFHGQIRNETLDTTHTYANEPVKARSEAEFPEQGLDDVTTAKKVADLEARLAELEKDESGRDTPLPPALAALALVAAVLLARRL